MQEGIKHKKKMDFWPNLTLASPYCILKIKNTHIFLYNKVECPLIRCAFLHYLLLRFELLHPAWHEINFTMCLQFL